MLTPWQQSLLVGAYAAARMRQGELLRKRTSLIRRLQVLKLAPSPGLALQPVCERRFVPATSSCLRLTCSAPACHGGAGLRPDAVQLLTSSMRAPWHGP